MIERLLDAHQLTYVRDKAWRHRPISYCHTLDTK